MSVLEKFLNALKLNDDELDNDDYLDEPDDAYETGSRPVKRRIVRDRDEDELFDAPEEGERETASSARSFASAKSRERENSASSRLKQTASRLTAPRSRSKQDSENGMEVCVIRPHTMENAREITESLLGECTVILNVEGLELEIAQRIIDFASGSCYAIDGNLQKISNYIFVITPPTVDISGDFQEILSGAFDVPFEKRF